MRASCKCGQVVGQRQGVGAQKRSGQAGLIADRCSWSLLHLVGHAENTHAQDQDGQSGKQPVAALPACTAPFAGHESRQIGDQQATGQTCGPADGSSQLSKVIVRQSRRKTGSKNGVCPS